MVRCPSQQTQLEPSASTRENFTRKTGLHQIFWSGMLPFLARTATILLLHITLASQIRCFQSTLFLKFVLLSQRLPHLITSASAPPWLKCDSKRAPSHLPLSSQAWNAPFFHTQRNPRSSYSTAKLIQGTAEATPQHRGHLTHYASANIRVRCGDRGPGALLRPHDDVPMAYKKDPEVRTALMIALMHRRGGTAGRGDLSRSRVYKDMGASGRCFSNSLTIFGVHIFILPATQPRIYYPPCKPRPTSTSSDICPHRNRAWPASPSGLYPTFGRSLRHGATMTPCELSRVPSRTTSRAPSTARHCLDHRSPRWCLRCAGLRPWACALSGCRRKRHRETFPAEMACSAACMSSAASNDPHHQGLLHPLNDIRPSKSGSNPSCQIRD